MPDKARWVTFSNAHCMNEFSCWPHYGRMATVSCALISWTFAKLQNERSPSRDNYLFDSRLILLLLWVCTRLRNLPLTTHSGSEEYRRYVKYCCWYWAIQRMSICPLPAATGYHITLTLRPLEPCDSFDPISRGGYFFLPSVPGIARTQIWCIDAINNVEQTVIVE